MRSGRGSAFVLISAISLLLAIVVCLGWIWSFGDEFHLLSFVKGDQRIAVKLTWGQIVLFGPPDDAKEDAEEVGLSRQMSNEDFEWKGVSAGYVEGVARNESAT